MQLRATLGGHSSYGNADINPYINSYMDTSEKAELIWTNRDFQNQEYHFTSPGHSREKNKKWKNNMGNCKASCVSRKRDYFLRLKLMQGKLPKFKEFLLSNHLKTAARKSLKSERYLGSCQTSKMEIFVNFGD